MGSYDPILLDDDEVLDFNFCRMHDPWLKPGQGPSASWLYRMAYVARGNGAFAAGFASQLADTIHRTLTEEAFQSFQHASGHRPIRYEDWYCSKLDQFLSVLLFETLYEDWRPVGPRWGKLTSMRPWEEKTGILSGDPVAAPDEVVAAFSIERALGLDWHPIVLAVSRTKGDRLEALKRALAEQQGGQKVSSGRPSRLTPRDEIVLSCLERGEERRSICETLDRKGVPTTLQMRSHDYKLWADAWDDPDFRNNVQQMISKTQAKARGSVKG